MNILAFESSCDETAVAVVRDGRQVLSDAILSQADMHALYGGVVPEIASRKHVQAIAALSDKALADAGLTKKDVDAVAARLRDAGARRVERVERRTMLTRGKGGSASATRERTPENSTIARKKPRPQPSAVSSASP